VIDVLGFARTPFARFGGALREASLPELGVAAVKGALVRAKVEASEVEELALGVNFPGSDRSIARQVSLRSGIPETSNSFTVDRACCSSLTAISLASRSLRLGDVKLAVAGGAENLSAVPFFLEGARFGHRLGDFVMSDKLVVSCPHTHEPRAVQASREALEYGIDRVQQDEWSVRSQERYAKALSAGIPDEEIVPVAGRDGRGNPALIKADEVPRPDTTMERLAALSTIYGSETVTPGNAPDLSTGATAVVLAGSDVARGDRPALATLISFVSVSGEPARIASIPAKAIELALSRSDLALGDLSVIEINEAFAAVPLVSTLVLAQGDAAAASQIRERTNVNGGSIAVGHPTGATGARLLMTVIAELRRMGGGIGVAALCGGVGEAEAIVVRVD
jgi:acetyl-CoA C-acetyltransferase